MKKVDKYEKILIKLDSIFSGKLKLSAQAKMSLIASLLHTKFSHWTFCGFYVIKNSKMLEIGPYQGNILPCIHIRFGNGVCGASVEKRRSIIVDDVREYDNYISCDSDTLSEIVVPIFMKNKIVAVLDIDSPIIGDFDHIDKTYLEKISSFL